ncbi:MAG TPA: pyridoxamine 5'-phosphate oxidase family protein [Acidimicrobiales bacterium]|nr:pyridoxamine 5'-phosphate oxidase family protein [Acidimicrobiales bacterium]
MSDPRTGPGPRDATAIAGDATPTGEPLPWSEAERRLADAQTYWFATTAPGGGPHVRPVLGVWLDGTLHTTSGPGARKARNLEVDGDCAFSLSADSVDMVLEGSASRVLDPAQLERVAEAYGAKYGWPARVAGDAFDAPYGAPTAGPPPYQVYAVRPRAVYAFGTDEELAPRSTRWRF